jgi:uncharacterized protein (DUF302 family)
MTRWCLLLLLLLAPGARAAPPGVYIKTVEMDLDSAYREVYQALEEERFWVVLEADMGARMARMAKRWGNDYNRNGLDGMKSMVFCNIDWTHRIANADPRMLALCPLHLSIYARDGKASVVLPRPTALAGGSEAEAEAAELERTLIRIVEGAFD